MDVSGSTELSVNFCKLHGVTYRQIVTAVRPSYNTYVRYVEEDKRFSKEIRAMNLKPCDIV